MMLTERPVTNSTTYSLDESFNKESRTRTQSIILANILIGRTPDVRCYNRTRSYTTIPLASVSVHNIMQMNTTRHSASVHIVSHRLLEVLAHCCDNTFALAIKQARSVTS